MFKIIFLLLEVVVGLIVFKIVSFFIVFFKFGKCLNVFLLVDMIRFLELDFIICWSRGRNLFFYNLKILIVIKIIIRISLNLIKFIKY